MPTYYHVAGPNWRPGDALYNFEQLVQRGEAAEEDWKWGERSSGDGAASRIFLFADRNEADEFAAIYGGTLLVVGDPEGVEIDPAESYRCVQGPIPADLLEIA